ncbi:MAG: Ig-like domain-containing protein, partial [Candidatus Roizmanbacteria bacterium]|nr:Ig-like domain-containing protein [Candidatus Roizmanbacteria bacterium]
AVADAPAGTNATLTTVEDTALTLTPDNFGFSDPSDSPANALSAVKITALPMNGSLQLSGVAVTTGQVVSATNIANGNLIYTPALNGRGTGYANLTFQVQDDGSTNNGGVALDPTANTLTFDVTPVNDIPATSDFALSVNKNGSLTGINLTSHASDPDGGTSNTTDAAITSYKVVAVPDAAAGLLKKGSTTLAAGATLTLIEAASLTFVPTTNYIGSATFTFQAIDAAAEVSNTSTATITVAGVNLAPTVTVPGAQTVAEDASLTLAANITLADSDAGSGVVQAALSAAHGNVTLADLTGLTVTAGANSSHTVTVQGTLDAINAALARSKVSYAPDHDYPNSTSSATDTITVVANDLGNTGGAEKTATGSITVTVTPVADAPVSAASGNLPTLASVAEDATNPAGATVASLLSGKFSDVDGNTLAGVAVSANTIDATKGEWQYSADGGASWSAIGSVSTSSALLLNSSAFLRFLPAANWNGTPGTLTLQAIDNSASPGRTYTTAGSAKTIDAGAAATDLDPTGALLSTSVTPVDDASVPVADTKAVTEETAATGNVLTNDSDIDSTLTVASFQVAGDATVYTAGQTATITGKGTVTIAADGSYTFTPVTNWNGSAPVVTYTLNTGSTSTLSVSVTPVNDAPVLYVPGQSVGETALTATVEVGSTLTFSTSAIRVIDPDNTDAQLTFRLESLPTRGVLRYNGNPVGAGSVFSYANLGLLVYTDSGSTDGTDHFDVTLRDGAGGVVASTAVNLVVGGHNYAPNGMGTLTGSVWEDPTSYGNLSNNNGKLISAYSGYAFSDTNVADVSAGANGYAIVGNSADADTQGSWQYSTDSGTTWSGIGTVANTSDATTGALVLSTSTLVRFNPVVNYNGTPPALSVRVLDSAYTANLFSASGVSESRIFIKGTTPGGTSAVSATANTLTITVNAVDDDPVLATAATLNTGVKVLDQALALASGTISGTVTNALLASTDVDSSASQIRYTVTSAPTKGWLLNGGYLVTVGSSFTQADLDAGSIRYLNNYSQGATTDAFTVTVTDGATNVVLSRVGGIYVDGSNTTLQSIRLDISIPGDVPRPSGGGNNGVYAYYDYYTTNENTPIGVTVANLATNDVKPDGWAVTGISGPTTAHGTVSLSGGTATYTPATGYVGDDYFDYTLSGGATQIVFTRITSSPAAHYSDIASSSSATIVGVYGSVTLGADGAYSYTVNKTLDAVTALTGVQTLSETFSYNATASTGGTSINGSFSVTFSHVNVADSGINPLQLTGQINRTPSATGRVYVTVVQVNKAPVLAGALCMTVRRISPRASASLTPTARRLHRTAASPST